MSIQLNQYLYIISFSGIMDKNFRRKHKGISDTVVSEVGTRSSLLLVGIEIWTWLSFRRTDGRLPPRSSQLSIVAARLSTTTTTVPSDLQSSSYLPSTTKLSIACSEVRSITTARRSKSNRRFHLSKRATFTSPFDALPFDALPSCTEYSNNLYPTKGTY
jgi:hypothetical protein